jgi:uridine kinase
VRRAFLDALVGRISDRAGEGILRVGINGVDGSGKTTLADELAPLVAAANGLPVIRASIDGFHNPRAVRYTQGRSSPRGFYEDSFNLKLFRELLLDPLSPGGNRLYRPAAFDHRIDSTVIGEPQLAAVPSVLIVDGIFLLRPELAGYWDLSIFLDVPFTQSFARMSRRDGSPPEEGAAENLRYRDGQRLYFEVCKPQERADVLVDYADLERPAILRG